MNNNILFTNNEIDTQIKKRKKNIPVFQFSRPNHKQRNSNIKYLIIIIGYFLYKIVIKNLKMVQYSIYLTKDNHFRVPNNTQNINNLLNLKKSHNSTKGVGFECVNESLNGGRSYVDVNIEISYCSFYRTNIYIDDGGVIYVFAESKSMTVSFTMFYNCVCSGNGGAIYFKSNYSYLRMLCANSCSCGVTNDNLMSGEFAYISASVMNHGEFLSVSHCSNTSIGLVPISFISGNQKIDNTNSSMNSVYQYSGALIDSPSSFTSSYCTFSNNHVSQFVCIEFYGSSGKMLYANIIHCNSPHTGFGGVVCFRYGSPKMEYCIFQENQGILIYNESSSLEISNSFIDHTGISSSSNNNSLTRTMTYQLQYFSSHFCYADNPLPKSTIEETLMRTILESLKITMEKTIDQTIEATPKETIPRSYSEIICTNQMANKKQMSVIFSFLYPVITIMIT